MASSVIIPRILHHALVTLVIFMLCMEIIWSSGLEPVFENHSRMVKKGCTEKERKALFEIKRGFVDTFGALSSWESTLDCCQWRRVGCDNHTGHVTHLHLSALDYFDWTSSSRTSNISASLLDLKNLNFLNLSSNDFGGLPIPKFIGSLTNLVYLDLSGANFGKAIPHELGNLSKLNHLDLSYNYQFSGAIPQQFGNLSKLQHLDLSDTGVLEGGIFGWLFNLSSLVHLGLNGIDIGTSNDWKELKEQNPT